MKYVQVLIIVGFYFVGATSLAIAGEGSEKLLTSPVEGSRGFLDCSEAFPIDCNDDLSWGHYYNSCNGVNNVEVYSNHLAAQTGPEIVYELIITEQSNVMIHMEPYEADDMTLMLLADCEEDLCFASSDFVFGEETIMRCLVPGTYYIVVDGYNGACGEYSMNGHCYPCDLPIGGETCEEADFLPGEAFTIITDTRGSNNDYSMEDGNTCTGYATDSGDIVYHVFIPPGGGFHATFYEDTYDASIFLVTDCNDVEGSCLDGDDCDFYPCMSYIDYDNTTNDEIEAFLIVSGFSVGRTGLGTLTYEQDWIERACCHGDTCSLAMEWECDLNGGEWLLDAVSCDPPNPCMSWEALYDWDFATGDHGFTKVSCDDGGVECWEYGASTYIPDPPGNVWGTILNGNCPAYCGEGILSPAILVGEGNLLEIEYYIHTSFEKGGGNVTVNGELIHPIGGYRNIISEGSTLYAYCVDGEWGWSGPFSSTWKSAVFDLNDFAGEEIAFEFDFGTDYFGGGKGWYISKIRVLAPPTADAPLPEHLSEHLGDLFRLQVFPNPSASYARLSFDLAGESSVELEILNVVGRRLRTLASGNRSAGHHDLIWDLRDEMGHKVAPGVYWTSFKTAETKGAIKLIIVD